MQVGPDSHVTVSSAPAPAAPAQSETLMKPRERWMARCLMAVRWTAALYFLSIWFSHRDWEGYPVSFTVLTFSGLAVLASWELLFSLIFKMRRPLPLRPVPGLRVAVATTFVPGGESLDMLEETLTAMVALRYPHENWLLDEGDLPEVKQLCARLGIHHFSRKHRPEYHTPSGEFEKRSKHGNYNAWLRETGYGRYDVLVNFDTDHVPRAEFLDEVLGYFRDEKVAYVQVAQSYYNKQASFIARGAIEENYSYHSIVQMASYAQDYPIVIGGHNVHRVSVLQQVGGFAAHAADDLLITLFYRSAGWRGVYVPKVLAKGLTPVDWQGYMGQQLRWARSVLDIKMRLHPQLSRHLPRSARLMSYLQGGSYLLELGLGLATRILLVYFLLTGSAPQALAHLNPLATALVLGAYLGSEVFTRRYFLDPRHEGGWTWRAGLLRNAKWPMTLLGMMDVVLGRQFPFLLTRKAGRQNWSPLLFWPHLLIVLITAAAWITGYLLGARPPLVIHLGAALVVLPSLFLMVSAFWQFPDPYDRRLLQQWLDDTRGPVIGAGGRAHSA